MLHDHKVNEQIKDRVVDLVLPDGGMERKVSLADAIQRAYDFGMDLVKVSDSADGSLSVCKIMDFGKLKYHESKKQKNQAKHHLKEIKYRFNTSDHDVQIKHKKVQEFLTKHYKVVYAMELSGREKSQLQVAQEKIIKNLEQFSEIASWKDPSVSNAKNRIILTTTLSPK